MAIRLSDDESSEIRVLDLFSGIHDDNFSRLIRAAYVQNFPPQIDLFKEGEASDFLHVVIGGSVELFTSWNGRETSMATLHPVSTFTVAATVKSAPYLMSARTLEKSRIILVPSEDVREIFDADPRFARAVVSELAQGYRAFVRSTKNLKLRTSLERLANYLVQRRACEEKKNVFDLGIEKRRLASHLGMTQENLSRAFRQLQPYGVEIEGSLVTIADPADLEKFAKPSSLIDGLGD